VLLGGIMNQTSDLLKKRVYALTMDLFVVVVTNYFLMASFTNFVKTVFFSFPLRAQIFLVSKFAIMSSVSLAALTFAYFSLFYFVTNGRTMGKTLFGLKVETKDGSELTLNQSMLRAFSYFVSAFFAYIPFGISFLRKDGKSLADLFSGTAVSFDKGENTILSGTEFQLTLVESIEDPEYFEQNKAA
jgi:uncharacterized RDD family membrane protein YckC